VSNDYPGKDDPRRGSRNLVWIAIAGAIVVGLAVFWFLSGNRNPDQDKLSNPQVQQTVESDSSKACSENATYDLVKRELFRRAAEVGGKDWPAFDQVSQTAVLRAENSVLEGEENGSLSCSGTFYLDLPPGLAVAGGRSSLTSNIDYVLQRDGVIVLHNADAMISSLASLQRVAAVPPEGSDANAVAAAAEGNATATVSANVEPGPLTGAPGRPSFDCARAGSSGEQAVCQDSGLAALDLNMATQYRRSLATATPVQKQLLQTTRDRFLAYRDRCPNRKCIADAYVGRMREIRDIMEGRLTPAR
jgi:uncharacterized protein YecT (DUF1311 family)